mgnify:CR=1 FL=1
MIYAPSHIKKYAKQIQGENKYFRDGIYGEVTFAYEISCNCGNKEFVVYKNSEPKVIAFCTSSTLINLLLMMKDLMKMI